MCKLSIIIPTYNSGKLIEELLDGLDKLRDVEFVFVDDGSTDNTVDIIKNRLKQNNTEFQFQIFLCKHCGVSHARNVGLTKSNSARVMFVDADDRIDPQILQQVIDDDASSADIISFTKNCQKQYQISDKHPLIAELLLNKHEKIIPAPFSKIYKSEFLKTNNIFFAENVVVGEDMLFNLKAILKSNSILISGKSFYLYRQNANSVTKSINYDIEKNSLNFVNELFDILKKFPEHQELLNRVVINSWVGDSIMICRYQFNKEKLVNLKKNIHQKYSFSEIFSLRLGLKKDILKMLLLINAYQIVLLLLHSNKKISVPSKSFMKI